MFIAFPVVILSVDPLLANALTNVKLVVTKLDEGNKVVYEVNLKTK